MNNFILISKTYCETDPESLEFGDFSDTGFTHERCEVSFRELVDLMKKHYNASESPNRFNSNHTWYESNWYTEDYRTGTERCEAIHFHKDNTPNAEKYWHLAARIAANQFR